MLNKSQVKRILWWVSCILTTWVQPIKFYYACLFSYLYKIYLIAKQCDREEGKDRSSIWWFTLQMATKTSAGLNQILQLGTYQNRPCGWQGPKHLSYLLHPSRAHYQATGLQMEQPGLKLGFPHGMPVSEAAS